MLFATSVLPIAELLFDGFVRLAIPYGQSAFFLLYSQNYCSIWRIGRHELPIRIAEFLWMQAIKKGPYEFTKQDIHTSNVFSTSKKSYHYKGTLWSWDFLPARQFGMFKPPSSHVHHIYVSYMEKSTTTFRISLVSPPLRLFLISKLQIAVWSRLS